MKSIYKLLACALLTASVGTQAMDKPKKKKHQQREPEAFTLQNWALGAGNIILGSLNPTQGLNQIKHDKGFLTLSDMTRAIIFQNLQICAQPRSLPELSQAINSLVNNSPQLDALINDPGFSLSLIKNYSKKFDTNNETVAKEIRTVGTQKRLNLQEKFLFSICSGEVALDPLTVKDFRSSNFDLNFTDKDGNTPAERCILLGNVEGLQVFLDRGVNPEPLYSVAVNIKQSNQSKNISLIVQFLEAALYQKFNKEKNMKEANK